MSTWLLRLLGPLAIESPTGVRAPRLGRKGWALLACAAAHGGSGVPRSRLLQLLWQDRGPEEARSALRQCLHHVRAELGEAAAILVTDADRIGVSDAACVVDARAFEMLAHGADVPAMLAAAARYRGDFAEDVEAGPEFNQWATVERERLRDLAHGVVARLSERELDADAFDEATRLARQLLAADGVHEGTWRALMRLYANAGLRSKALQAWAECCRILRDELGVEPSAPTTELAAVLAAAPVVSPSRAFPTSAQSWREASATQPGSPLWSQEDPEVLDLMLRGWTLFTTYTAEGQAQARRVFEQVIERSPRQADALTLLGWTHWFDAISGWSPEPDLSYRQAMALADRAMACGVDNASAHGLMGKVLLWRMEHAQAVEQLRQAVALAPGYAYMHFHLGDALTWCGRPGDAMPHLDRALRLDPNDHGVFLTVRGLAHWMAGDLPAAHAALASALRRNPAYAWAHGLLAVVQHESGDPDGARRSAQAGQRLNPRFSVQFADRVMPFLLSGHRRRLVEAWRAAGMPAHEGAAGGAGRAP